MNWMWFEIKKVSYCLSIVVVLLSCFGLSQPKQGNSRLITIIMIAITDSTVVQFIYCGSMNGLVRTIYEWGRKEDSTQKLRCTVGVRSEHVCADC